MTRLVNADRDRIRRAILAEVPKVDYDAAAEKRMIALAVHALPAHARRVWDDTANRALLRTETVSIKWPERDRVEGCWYAFSVSVPGFHGEIELVLQSDAGLAILAKDKRDQEESRAEINRTLQNNLASVHTHEAFSERWPELVKYLPDGSEVKAANLPATTDLIDKLKAAGLEV